ncbi:DUF2293 domain-containing protein [Chelativorans sp. AA-79]|uniref:DUF2293 domain-containing protein n=1 Tax=Chelativorans sp. AA-79 TaxID=3028735 RepID=UPI0023F98FC3|nr:DUF2293 domain-containing protein [Chelativorans sp. AA-79]WEX11326.1 DUF2293 domain-containing protein [Chelativorans sp. AA-79]
MKAPTTRRRAVDKALTALLPQAPYSDTEAIRTLANDRKLRSLPASVTVWLATVAHVRHVHSDYDQLLAEGYDRDAARFFVVDQINDVLTHWRATRLLDPDEDEGEFTAGTIDGGPPD